MFISIIETITSNNGHINSLSGVVVVFMGLIAISLTISIFNKIAYLLSNSKINKAPKEPNKPEKKPSKKTEIKEVPEDELIAIATAVEVYRKLHFEILQNEITFTHGSAQTPWKMIQKTRKSITRAR